MYLSLVFERPTTCPFSCTTITPEFSPELKTHPVTWISLAQPLLNSTNRCTLAQLSQPPLPLPGSRNGNIRPPGVTTHREAGVCWMCLSVPSIPQSIPSTKLSSRGGLRAAPHGPLQSPTLGPQVLSLPPIAHTQAPPASPVPLPVHPPPCSLWPLKLPLPYSTAAPTHDLMVHQALAQ